MFLETLKGLDTFITILKNLIGIGKELDEQEAELINILGTAARNTENALNKLRNGINTIPELETTIAYQWVKASSLLKKNERDLALQLYKKGQAWTNSKNWTDEDFNIAVANVRLVDAYVQKLILKQ